MPFFERFVIWARKDAQANFPSLSLSSLIGWPISCERYFCRADAATGMVVVEIRHWASTSL
jgi:hypothetical protein